MQNKNILMSISLLTVIICTPLIAAGHSNYFFGINPLAIPAAMNIQQDLKRYLPEATGLEYGLAVFAGKSISNKIDVETRLSIGKCNKLALVGQIHAGGKYYLADNFYCGALLKFWDYHNTLSHINFYNLAPYAALGYKIKIHNFFIDFRLNQTIAVLSFSSLEHTRMGADWFFSPWPSFVPVLPSFSINIGKNIHPGS